MLRMKKDLLVYLFSARITMMRLKPDLAYTNFNNYLELAANYSFFWSARKLCAR